MHRLGRYDRLAKRRIVGRHGAPAEDFQSFPLRGVFVDFTDDVAPRLVTRQEQMADAILSRLRQSKSEFFRLARKELVRNLHEDAGAIAHTRIGASRAAMLEIAENLD